MFFIKEKLNLFPTQISLDSLKVDIQDKVKKILKGINVSDL